MSGTRRPTPPATDPVEKRTAFEPPSRLAEREAAPARVRRPAATTFGAALVLLRVLVGIVWLIGVAVQWDEIVANELDFVVAGQPTPAALDAGRTVVLVAGSTLLLLDLLLTVLIWYGSNGARVTVMLIAAANITIAAIDSVTGDAEVTIRTTFITVALDILILLALSSREARSFARRTRGFARPRRDEGA
ncbi:hypothetical protein ACFPER_06330 [Agromyces aurantiacus]|uniref:DUF2127 domain-containing protein n=1 Tax=Agromyces aurantiacus TaxID=165814 RepID=A0ABV9R4L9_9MICO|nr:hypothetical protein [Agromyces aurantiacus]MBM7503080.1 hypothetical protein [Agromyces aurantiacus]